MIEEEIEVEEGSSGYFAGSHVSRKRYTQIGRVEKARAGGWGWTAAEALMG